ncbi:hypothetical protein [Streptomyces sp. NBC_01233]|uniref:hypothetical protein n=1 Tax=Streptomyces sp. NBC_01233 TaxID=2903787 RepID=UPI002E12C86C|nr:hypothetical protein OG332_03845 [Streptomyces sp. NBC_01233]
MAGRGNDEAVQGGWPARSRPYPHARQAHARPEPIGHVDGIDHFDHFDHFDHKKKIDYETYERYETTDRGGG